MSSAEQIVDDLDAEWLTRWYRDSFDSTLGWEPKPHFQKTERNKINQEVQWSIDRFGARNNPSFDASLTPYVAAFGDSFTFGQEVNDNETWAYLLSLLLTRQVANYGVGGYGTDQAFLRYQETLHEGLRPTIAILGIYHENFKRVLNRFRPFYYPQTGLKLGFKPKAYLNSRNQLSFYPPALDREVWDRTHLIQAIDSSREGDFWAAYRPAKAFPYSANVLRAMYLRVCEYAVPGPPCNPAREPTWHTPQVQSLMRAFIQEFVILSREKGIEPMILFLSFEKQSPYAWFIKEIRDEYKTQHVHIIDTTDAEYDFAKVSINPDGGHLSPYGNRMVAEHIVQYFPEAEKRNRER